MEVGKINGKVCPVCGAEDVHIGTGAAHITDDENQSLLDYTVWTCTCHSCGAPIYNKEMEALNRIADAEATRTIFADRLSLKQIRGLPIKYAIPRKEFCSVMGVPKTVMDDIDEVPFKLFDGDLPDMKLERRLRSVYSDPKQWVEFLKLAENRIPKDVFDKSMEKAMSIIGE